ncbi:MAG: alpha-L-glutamate ligase [Acidobacteria bacterium]|nr:MAG: alpha-L-glutamate ligase [Acidobacteriota bacterium]
MHACFITDNPDTHTHPVIGAVLEQLSAKHHVRVLDVCGLTARGVIAHEEKHSLADIYLLKSHAVQALEVARALEHRGALVVNSWFSSMTCQDRVLMADRMRDTGIAWPRTRLFVSSEDLPGPRGVLSELAFPLMIKSRYSCRGDLVARVDCVEQLGSIVRRRNEDSFILQEFVAGDGSDVKMWVIGQDVFAARRSSVLESMPSHTVPLVADEVPHEWASMALKIGRIFGLRLYGVDLLISRQGPVAIDVNAFPGFRGVPRADAALIALIERLRGYSSSLSAPASEFVGDRRV